MTNINYRKNYYTYQKEVLKKYNQYINGEISIIDMAKLFCVSLDKDKIDNYSFNIDVQSIPFYFSFLGIDLSRMTSISSNLSFFLDNEGKVCPLIQVKEKDDERNIIRSYNIFGELLSEEMQIHNDKGCLLSFKRSLFDSEKKSFTIEYFDSRVDTVIPLFSRTSPITTIGDSYSISEFSDLFDEKIDNYFDRDYSRDNVHLIQNRISEIDNNYKFIGIENLESSSVKKIFPTLSSLSGCGFLSVIQFENDDKNNDLTIFKTKDALYISRSAANSICLDIPVFKNHTITTVEINHLKNYLEFYREEFDECFLHNVLRDLSSFSEQLDIKNGVRYGYLSPHNLSQKSFDEIYNNRDTHFEVAKKYMGGVQKTYKKI